MPEKKATLGFKTATSTPCLNIFISLSGESWSFTEIVVPSDLNAYIPSQIRYAAPIHLTVKNATAEVAKTADNPKAAKMTWINATVQMPNIAETTDFTPRLAVCPRRKPNRQENNRTFFQILSWTHTSLQSRHIT